MVERMKNYSWYALVFLLPWQTVWILREVFVAGEKWQYATVGLYASDVALLSCAAFSCVAFRRKVWNEMRRDAAIWILVALFAWTFLSALWAIEGSLALLSAWRIFLMTLLYALARYGGFPIRKTLLVFLVSITLQASFALSQWVGQCVLPSTILGIAEHDPARWGTVVLKTESGRFLRASGGFEHPNVLGGALAMATIFGAWLSVTTKNIFARRWLLGMTIVSSFALVFTFSRSGWLAFWVGVCVSSFFAVKRNKYRVLLALFITAVSFLTAFFLVRDIAMSRFSNETLARERSLSDRTALLDQGFSVIRERPFLGAGGGNFTAFTQERFPEAGRFVGDFQPVHAVPILVFAELGAIGFVLFALLFVFGFIRAWRDKNSVAGAILCALLPLLFLDHWLWSGHFGAIFLGFLLGCRFDEKPKNIEKK